MLKTIDVLIGVSVVMLIVSMVVTILTQFVTSVLNSRGKHLMQGIADLLEQIDPKLSREIAEEIAAKVLTHPLIRESTKRLGAVVQREELSKLLMELAAGSGPQALSEAASAALSNLMKANGISEPGQVLANVHALALHLERVNPELATNTRHSLALLQEANSQLVAKVNAWFDQTIDRVSDRFTGSARAITVVCSLLVAFVLQLDTAALVNRLSVDDALRRTLVEKAIELNQNPPPVVAPQPAQAAPAGDAGQPEGEASTAGTATTAETQPAQPVLRLTEKDRENLAAMMQAGLIDLPTSWGEWWARWSDSERPVSIPGILLTGMLLSLGAPFWYNALKNLTRLRSALAEKDDSQRQERQSAQAPPGAAPGGATAPSSAAGSPLASESGDLRAFG